MRFPRLAVTVVLALGLGSVLTGAIVLSGAATAAAPDDGASKDRPGDAAAPKAQTVTLTTRADNGPYGQAAYSFRRATHDVAVHNNYVDVLLNRCGQLHVSPTAGYASRICDLGKSELAGAPDAPPEGAAAAWKTESIRPVAGHVYLLEIDESGQTMTVRFAVDEVTPKGVKLAWLTVKAVAGPAPNRGRAGTMGQCGGDHDIQ
jgi:hypothetical protein